MNGALARERRRLGSGPDDRLRLPALPEALSSGGEQGSAEVGSAPQAAVPPIAVVPAAAQPRQSVHPELAASLQLACSERRRPDPDRREDHGEADTAPAGMASRATSFPWRLRSLPVCASTELELNRWLARLAPGPDASLPGPLAVLARRQRFGRGQQGRFWSSPAGGVWLSAALPWPADPASAAAPGLAVAVGLALELEALGLEVRLKWPNDLLLAGPDGRVAKLAGLLPALRLRGGTIRWARVGLGLNGINRIPPGATNLRHALGLHGADPIRLGARVLRALDWAMAAADHPTWVRRQAEARLLVAPRSWQGASDGWQPQGLADDGALVLARGDERRRLHRRFD